MDPTLFDALRYRSEGTDLDFKQAQYRFIRAPEDTKAELLKDVLAMANAWREGTAYILLGFKDARPNPAEVVGITEHLDDASVQQFINGKVKPKLTFTYEEHHYEGKTVAVIAVPKQPRPFYLQSPYGGLKSNVVYVRRGSSTDEADPPEAAKMALADAGKIAPVVNLSVTDSSNEPLQPTYERCFLTFERMPNYRIHESPSAFSAAPTLWSANSSFWRELAEFVGLRVSALDLQYALTNRSGFALTGAKLEVAAKALDGQKVLLMLGSDLPDFPESQYNRLTMRGVDLASRIAMKEPQTLVEEVGNEQVCHMRLGTLLPGETGRASDTLVINPLGAGRVLVKCRVLAAELSIPFESEFEVKIDGANMHLDLEGLQAFVKSPIAMSLLGPAVADEAGAA